MKVVYPKNIKKWLLAWLTFQIGPISISIIQLFIIALGVAAALAVFNYVAKAWSKIWWVFFAVVIIIITIVIAFFKISELTLIPFIAKMLRNNLFDTRKKYQNNYTKNNPVDILIKESKSDEEKKIIEQKDNKLDEEILKKIKKGWLMSW